MPADQYDCWSMRLLILINHYWWWMMTVNDLTIDDLTIDDLTIDDLTIDDLTIDDHYYWSPLLLITMTIDRHLYWWSKQVMTMTIDDHHWGKSVKRWSVLYALAECGRGVRESLCSLHWFRWFMGAALFLGEESKAVFEWSGAKAVIYLHL